MNRLMRFSPFPSSRPSMVGRRLRLAGAALIAAAVFVIDTFTPLSSAVAVLYVLVLLLVGEELPGRRLWTVTLACAAMATISFAVAHGEDVELAPTLRLMVSLAALGVAAFLTDRNLQAREILQAQARLLDVTSDAIFIRDAQGRITFWNRGAERLYGWSRQEAVGQDAHRLLATALPAPSEDIAAHVARHGAWQGEVTQRRKDGATLIVLSEWILERDAETGAHALLESNTDISDLRRADEALRRSEARYRTIFNTLAVSIWEHDFRPVRAALDALRAQGVGDLAEHLARHPEVARAIKAQVGITDVNATALKMMGVADKAGFFQRLDELLPETDDSFSQFLIAFDSGAPRFETETTVRSRTGEMIPVMVALNFPPDAQGLDRVQASIVDLTEQRRMQERLDRARAELEHALRAATLGVLSASIAHEVNQPLAAISNAAGAAQRWLDRETPDLDEAKEAVADVVHAAAHAAEVVRGIRGLIAQTPADRPALPVDELLTASAGFVRREIAEHGVELVLDQQAADTVVQGDRVVLQQALVNLMLNGVQAMAGCPAEGRRLHVRARRDGDEAVVEIADTGPGFPPDAADRAFEAFFTTKPGGMGLGLAICQSAVAAHDGRIAVLPSAPGETGARIEIRLPAGSR